MLLIFFIILVLLIVIVLAFAGLVLQLSVLQILFSYYSSINTVLSATWWFVFPIALFYVFNYMYKKYVWREYKSKLEWSLIEIKPPRNIERSPRTMEQVFMGLHGTISTPSIFDKYFKGRLFQPMFMFEIRGINGEMHFYARTEKRFRSLVESLIYAQYPDAEIEEAEDYTMAVPANVPNAEWDLWGADFEFIRPDPYPIRTYHKFQEDVTKGMIDPLGSLADMITGLPPGIEAWFQFLIIPIKDNEWDKQIRKVINKLAGRETEKEAWAIINFFTEAIDILISSVKYIFGPVEEKKEEKKEEQPLQFRLTPVEKDILEAVEQSFSKKAFKTKIRLVVLGPREVFKEDFRKLVLGYFFQFNDPNLNSLKTNNDTKTYANYFFVQARKLGRKERFSSVILRVTTMGQIS